MKPIAFLPTAFVTTASLQAAVLLQDDFNDNSLDSSKWTVVTAGISQDPKSVLEQNQQIELEGRAHLNTVSTFDPDLLGGLSITGRMEFVSDDDFSQFLTRSDGTPSGGFGETANGLEFALFGNGGVTSPQIRGRGGVTVGSVVQGATVDVVAGDIFDFTIVDEGAAGLSFTITRVNGAPFTSTTTAVLTGDSVVPSLVTFHNREAGRRLNLDDVVISSIPEPSSLAMLGLAGFGLIRRRR